MNNRNTLTRTARTYRKGGKSKKKYGTRLSEGTLGLLAEYKKYNCDSAADMLEKGVLLLVKKGGI